MPKEFRKRDYDDELVYKLPLFYHWKQCKVRGYFDLYPDDFRENPSTPPRKGVPGGNEYPLSYAKYEAAVHSVLYGTKFKGYKLNDVLGYMDYPPSPGLFRTWRSESRFKNLLEKLKNEFAEYMAGNIIYNEYGKPLPEHYPWKKLKRLRRKILFIGEGLLYSPDLLSRISLAIDEGLTSNPVQGGRDISHYLGSYMWTTTLLYSLAHLAKKSPKRTVYIDICKKAVGGHWRDPFLEDYLRKINPHREWFFKIRSQAYEGEIDRGLYLPTQSTYFTEFSAILNAEILKLANGKNNLHPADITTSVDFLARRHKFYRHVW
jgi:hypothetical protein